MAVNESLQKDLNRLTKPEKSITPLQRVRQAEAIQRARGRGVPKVNPSTQVNIEDVKREVLTVFSSLIITDEGAFEKPPNWPTSGAYPGKSFVLDTGAQYYEQRRVHYLLTESLKSDVLPDGSTSLSGSTIIEEQLYVPLAHPFEGDYYQGIVGYSNFGLDLSMTVSAVTTNQKVGQVKQVLLNQGVTLL